MSRPQERLRSERSQFRAMWIVVAGLVAWPAFGFVREPTASWPERCVVIVLACCFAAPMIGTMGYRTERNREGGRGCAPCSGAVAWEAGVATGRLLRGGGFRVLPRSGESSDRTPRWALSTQGLGRTSSFRTWRRVQLNMLR